MRIAGRIAEFLVGVAFAWAGVVKLLDPSAFLSAILTYEVFPYQLAVAASLITPYLEICIGGCLAFRVMLGGARLIGTGLLFAFIGLLTQAALRGLDADCGCFGSSVSGSESGYTWPIIRDILMLVGLYGSLIADRLKNSGGAE